jgi:hypothetical protein
MLCQLRDGQDGLVPGTYRIGAARCATRAVGMKPSAPWVSGLMRMLLGLYFAGVTVVPAGAQPAPPAPPAAANPVQPAQPGDPWSAKPLLHIDSFAPNPPTTQAQRVPGLHGVTVLGMTLVPPELADARDWSEGGMVMRPPETGDDNVLVPGFDSLPWFRSTRPRGPLATQLLRGIERGVGAVIELVVPPGS